MTAPDGVGRRSPIRSSRRRWVRVAASRALLILSGVLFACVTLEAWFRLCYPDPRPRLANAGLRLDDTYGVSFVPGSEGWNTSLRGEYSVYVKINSKGMRDVEHEYSKKPGVTRILVLGDSMTAAIQVPLADTFVKVLEERLQDAFPTSRFEVVNAGIIGYGTTNELLFFRDEGYRYEPDIVLLVFFTGNDVTDNVLAPLFELKDGTLTELPARYPSTRLLAPWERPGGFLRNARNFLYTHSRLYSVSIELLVYSAVQRWPPLLDWLVNAGMVEVTRPAMNLGNIYAFLDPPPEAWTMTEALIMDLKRQVETHGGRLVVAILPDESEVDEKRWQAVLESYPELRERQAQVLERPTERIARFLEDQDVDYVQLAPALRRCATESEDSLYYCYDGHFTPLAHRVVGQTIADYFVQESGVQ